MRLAFVAATLAFALSAEPASLQAQAPASWDAAMAMADVAYLAEMESAEDRRRKAILRAGDTWLRIHENEIVVAAGTGDAATAQILQAKIDEARAAGKAPLPRSGLIHSFSKHDYALLKEPMTWHEAKAHCEKMGGRLLILDSAAEERFAMQKWGKTPFFVGGEEVGSTGTYRWLDGKPFRTFEKPFEADNNQNRQNVVCWLPSLKKWNDTEEGKRLRYVCEWE